MHIWKNKIINIWNEFIFNNYINIYINSLINVYYDMDLQWGGENLTLVQASIADNGNSVILIADRLLTSRLGGDEYSRYEFEWNKEKILNIGNVGVGFSGSALFADRAERKMNEIKDKDLDKILGAISNYIKEEKNNFINQFIQNQTGLNSDDFFNNIQLPPSPDEVRSVVYAFLNELPMFFEFRCIVCGFDKENNARLVAIDHDGNSYNMTNFGNVQIGSGETFSRIYFDLYDYRTTVSESDGLFFAYKAKKWAEAPTGVGRRTDILIFRKKGKPLMIIDGSSKMHKIEEIYQEELKQRQETRGKLVKRLDKIICDVKK